MNSRGLRWTIQAVLLIGLVGLIFADEEVPEIEEAVGEDLLLQVPPNASDTVHDEPPPCEPDGPCEEAPDVTPSSIN